MEKLFSVVTFDLERSRMYQHHFRSRTYKGLVDYLNQEQIYDKSYPGIFESLVELSDETELAEALAYQKSENGNIIQITHIKKISVTDVKNGMTVGQPMY